MDNRFTVYDSNKLDAVEVSVGIKSVRDTPEKINAILSWNDEAKRYELKSACDLETGMPIKDGSYHWTQLVLNTDLINEHIALGVTP